ncbi:duf1753 domain containing protein [Grosmannia clavigera kw1407]|uniref:Duf1753 domain containing protein n=1 Tax=Grosmannia clavigera (strain kw1407 / UAMH 11150) TaxID=655863 RepID=F0XSQ3_GROCL|nr:duf1753 domain containing protein [Grosmannia clavigera kw1407]EFW99071.1 duf1753 domain containing protein [Grosmannia clavigera kw1407]
MAFFSTITPWFRLPRPKTFLGFVPLQLGTGLIVLTLLFNKLTGLYGVLALITGFSLNATQLSAYFYNIAVLVTVAICLPHIRRETPLPNLVLAWVYAIDTIANAAYTTVFAIGFYNAVRAGKYGLVPGAIDSLTDATISSLAVATALIPTPTSASTIVRRDAETIATVTAGLATATANVATVTSSSIAAVTATVSPIPTAGSGGWMGAHEASASLTLVVIVTVVRVYFSLVLMSYARRVLQRYSEHVANLIPLPYDDSENDANEDKGEEGSGWASHDAGDDDIDDEEAGLNSGMRSSRGRSSRRRNHGRRSNKSGSGRGNGANPFAIGWPAGEGWKGKVGRALVTVGRGYWLNRERDDNWSRDIGAKVRSP